MIGYWKNKAGLVNKEGSAGISDVMVASGEEAVAVEMLRVPTE